VSGLQQGDCKLVDADEECRVLGVNWIVGVESLARVTVESYLWPVGGAPLYARLPS
jgi:hypothetical protein